MPELPEVETVVRGLMPLVLGARTGLGWSDWPGVLDGLSLDEFNRQVQNRTVERIFRRGKYICMVMGDLFLVVHLRMTGRLYLSPNREGDDKWVHFSLALDGNRFLAFSDSRKFGRVTLTPSLAYLEEKLGPEPLDLKDSDFKRILRGSTRAVKSFLLDQKKLAGVGNIYADESLWLSKIHPLRPVDQLSDRERASLGRSVVQILQNAIDYEGASISWYRKPDGSQGESQKHFSVYGRDGQPCTRCGSEISKIVVGQRGTHFCGKCQK